MSDDLVAWIREQLDEDERVASGSLGGHVADAQKVWEYDGRRTVLYGHVVIAEDAADAYPRNGEHIALHDPARVLREVEATRRILDEHYIIERKVNWTDGEGEDRQTHLPVCVVCVPKYSYIGTRDQAVGPCETVKLLALPLADRPGYRSEWAPSARRVNQT